MKRIPQKIKRHARQHGPELMRFLVVGGFSTVVNYALFFALFTFMGIHYQIASASGFMAGVLAGYPLNKQWTYKHKGHVSIAKKIRYGAVYGGSLALSLAFLYLVVDCLGVDARWANVLSIGLTTCTNFIGTKFLVFRNRAHG